MKTVEKVWKQLSEVNLSSGKVELSKIDDLLDIQQEIEAYLGTAIKEASDVEALFRKVRDRNETRSKNADKLRQKAFQLTKEISDAYKSLGEKMPTRVNNAYDKIADDARKIPTTNLANIFPI